MNKQSTYSIILAMLLLAAIAACTPPSTGEIRQVQDATGTPAVGQPAEFYSPECPGVAAYGAVQGTSPALGEVTSTTPGFEWYYYFPEFPWGSEQVGDWEQVCVPDSYTLYLSSGPEFDDEIPFYVHDPYIRLGTDRQTMEWTLDGTLQPLTIYRWTVVGHVGDIAIDDFALTRLHDDEWWPPMSPYPAGGWFRTGPDCGYNLAPPQLISPADGEVINTLNPVLTWEVNNCMPYVYLVEISTMPGFDDPRYFDIPTYTSYLPGNYTIAQYTYHPSIYVEKILRNCTDYYWRVHGGISHTDLGASSLIRSFSVDLGDCTTFTGIASPTSASPIEQLLPTDPSAGPPTEPPTESCFGMDEVTCNGTHWCIWEASKSGGFCRAR